MNRPIAKRQNDRTRPSFTEIVPDAIGRFFLIGFFLSKFLSKTSFKTYRPLAIKQAKATHKNKRDS